MITNRLAVTCAEVLQKYCDEQYSCNNGRCPRCIFSYPGMTTCYLEMFVGVHGKEMQELAKQKVEQRLRDLTKK